MSRPQWQVTLCCIRMYICRL